MQITVQGCYCYPIKACRGVQVDVLQFDDDGHILGDREWVVVDSENRITWLGEIPALAQLAPILTTKGLDLVAPDGTAITLPPLGETAPCTVRSWNSGRSSFDSLDGFDAGADVAAFASAVAGQSVRIVGVKTREHRPNPVHIISLPSCHELLPVGAETSARESSVLRFRPNLVINADDLAPFAEESARRLVAREPFDPLTLNIQDLCARCVVVNVEPTTGRVTSTVLSAVAKASRARHPTKPPFFGLYARARTRGRLRVGTGMTLC